MKLLCRLALTAIFACLLPFFSTLHAQNSPVPPCSPSFFQDTVELCPHDSLFFNGQYLHTNGIYLDTLVNAEGCDSFLTVTLIFHPASTDTVTAGICQGDSLFFNGLFETQSGYYQDTLQSTAGCDSILTLHLLVNTPSYHLYQDSICQGGFYSFYGQILNTSGDYYDTLVNTHGCDSIVGLQLIVFGISQHDIFQQICQSDSFNFHHQWHLQAGNYYDTLQNAHGCDSINILHLSVTPFVAQNLLKFICQGDSFEFNHQQIYQSGTYLDTIPASSGCDTLVTLVLHVLPVSNTTITAGICGSGAYFFHGQYLTQSGTYMDTLQNMAGCDSFITLYLTVSPVSHVNVSATLCQGDSLFFANQYVYQPGIYTDTLVAANGCDSVIALHLGMIPFTDTILYHAMCQGSSYSFGGQLLTIPGLYTDTLLNAAGCDSIIKLHLSLIPSSYTNITHTICMGSSYFFAGNVLTMPGDYIDTLGNAAGCDSIVKLHLLISPPPRDTFLHVFCPGSGYSFGGQWLQTPGFYTDTLSTVSGCDSIAVLHLQLDNLIQADSVVLSGDSLTTQHYSSYQWFLNAVILPGANQQSVLFTQNGIYSVAVTDQFGCSDTISYRVTNFGVAGTGPSFCALFPNPNAGSFLLQWGSSGTAEVEIADMLGTIRYRKTGWSGTEAHIQCNLPDGIYMLRIQLNQEAASYLKFEVSH